MTFIILLWNSKASIHLMFPFWCWGNWFEKVWPTQLESWKSEGLKCTAPKHWTHASHYIMLPPSRLVSACHSSSGQCVVYLVAVLSKGQLSRNTCQIQSCLSGCESSSQECNGMPPLRNAGTWPSLWEGSQARKAGGSLWEDLAWHFAKAALTSREHNRLPKRSRENRGQYYVVIVVSSC